MSEVYPPSDQILSAMVIDASWQGDAVTASVGVEPRLLGRDGGPPGMGALVPVVDIVSGSCASRHAGDDWLATSDAWLHDRAPVAGPIEVTARPLRIGRRAIVLTCEVTGGGRPAATGTIEFSRIRTDRRSRTIRPTVDGEPVRIGSGPGLDRGIDDACGINTLGPGRAELPRSPFVENSTGTYQGGAVALLADAGAAAAVGTGARVVDLQYRFLARTGDGPAVTESSVIRSDGPLTVVRVEVTDTSTGDLVGLAVAGVNRPPG